MVNSMKGVPEKIRWTCHVVHENKHENKNADADD
jgi:hypothetical protein